MAVTKIHAIKATIHRAVAYICNPEKTESSILISSFGCSPETAAYDFKFALSKTSKSDPNQSYHLIQAFSPGEVSYDEAHQIGVELADQLLKGQHSYIVATHIDKGHVHNHIIFCAVNHISHQKYHDCTRSYYHIRKLSDTLCEQHHLSFLPPDHRSENSHTKWLSSKDYVSLRNQLRSDIDDAIFHSNSYREFLLLMYENGYTTKGESLDPEASKYISFRPPNCQRFIRGREESLGADYTKEQILKRIAHQSNRIRIPPALNKRPRKLLEKYENKKLINTATTNFQNNPHLKRWANTQNLKIAASTYGHFQSLSDLQEQLFQKEILVKNAKNNLIETEHQLKRIGEIIKYAEQYQTTHACRLRYQKSKNSELYLQKHETTLLLHDGAENMLRRYGIQPEKMDLEFLRQTYETLSLQRNEIQASYKSGKKEYNTLNRHHDTLKKYLHTQEPDRSHPSSESR